MHSTHARFSRPLWAVLPVLLLGLLAWSGCGQGNTDTSSESDGPPYQLGEAISDSTIALIVESEYGVDTIDAQTYQQRMQFMMQRTPPNQRSGDQMQSMHEQTVRRLVGSHVLEGEARATEISVDSAEISSQLEQIKGRYEDSTQFREELAKNDVSVDSLRRFIASRLRQRDLQQQMANTAESPSASDVEDYAYENRRISAQHILLRIGEDAPQPQVDSVQQVAQALVDSAKMSSVDFGELARRHSEGPSASEGGNLGAFTRDRMVEPFADAAYSLADSGDVYDEPVRTRFGFHVIRLTDSGTAMDTSQARQQMMQQRKQEAFDEELETLMQKTTVRANPSIVTAGLYEEEGSSSGG